MSYEHLEVDHDGHVATVRFNRPDKANALNAAILLEIERVALAFADDANTRAVIFTGTGKHFSSGADLSAATPARAEPLVLRRRHARYGERAIRALRAMDQITIAAWNGAAMGGGGCLALALDFRVGADDCFLQFPEIDLGMNLMWQSLPLVVGLVGSARAKRLVIGGDRVHADELLAWGVLDSRVARAELLATARGLAERYAAKPPIPAQMIKRSVNHIASALDQALMHMDADQNLFTQSTEDRRTAGPAYLAKRDVQFDGN